jgi:hypothetical protein
MEPCVTCAGDTGDPSGEELGGMTSGVQDGATYRQRAGECTGSPGGGWENDFPSARWDSMATNSEMPRIPLGGGGWEND